MVRQIQKKLLSALSVYTKNMVHMDMAHYNYGVLEHVFGAAAGELFHQTFIQGYSSAPFWSCGSGLRQKHGKQRGRRKEDSHVGFN